MKKLSIALMALVFFGFTFFFNNMVIAVPPMPDDLNMVPPDPSLPKELAGFSGKWEGTKGYFLIVEKINEEEAILLLYSSAGVQWERIVAKVVKERGKYKIWFLGRYGQNEISLRGKYLDLNTSPGTMTFIRVH